MFGLLMIVQGEKRGRTAVWCDMKQIGGVRFFTVTAERCRSRVLWNQRMQRAAKWMEKNGVSTALFPIGFSDWKPFEKRGIRAADDQYLRSMTAGEILRCAMAKKNLRAAECRVAILGDCMSAPVQKALMEIALRVRYTMLSAGGGGGELCSVLRREYGVSVLRNVREEQLHYADAVLTFGEAEPCGKEGCLWLPFGDVRSAEGYRNAAAQVVYTMPMGLENMAAMDCDRNALLSLLLESGTLHANELEVAEVMEIEQNA